MVAPDGSTTTLAGNGLKGVINGTKGPTGTTEFGGPVGVAVDAAGVVYVADQDANYVRRIYP
jgi:hypothetical protein